MFKLSSPPKIIIRAGRDLSHYLSPLPQFAGGELRPSTFQHPAFLKLILMVTTPQRGASPAPLGVHTATFALSAAESCPRSWNSHWWSWSSAHSQSPSQWSRVPKAGPLTQDLDASSKGLTFILDSKLLFHVITQVIYKPFPLP